MPRIMYNTCPYVRPITLEPVKNITDSMSILSDITENTSNSDKRTNIKLMFESELQKMNMNDLKSKCFANSITNVSKFKKQELVNRLTEEFELLWTYYSSINLPELKNICKSNNFDISLKKKEDIINVIMSHNSNCKTSLFFRKRKSVNRAPSGFVKPTRISDELASFLKKPSGSEMARTEVTHDINKYIRTNNLQDKENGRKINFDTKLATLFKLNESDELTYFNLQRYMSPHFLKKESEDKETDAFFNQIQSFGKLISESKLERELKTSLKNHELEEIKCEKQVKLKLLKEHEEEDKMQKEKQLKHELKKRQEIEKIRQQENEEENARLKQDEEQTQLDLIKQQEEETQLKKQKEFEKIKQQDIKNKKQVIPKNIKVIVWNHYIGENIIHHRCLCCKKVLISNTSFHVGHVISEKDGGTHEINNLRPICSSCNHSMGSENMIEFVKKYGLYIG